MTSNLETIFSEAPEASVRQLRDVLAGLELPHGRLSALQLEEVVRAVAARPELFEDLLVDDGTVHWALILLQTSSFEVKALAWQGDQPVDWHDHGGSSGAMAIADGRLEEQSRARDSVSSNTRSLGPKDSVSFGPEHLHDVNYVAGRPALSIHAYSPPLSGMTHYDRTRFGFVAREFKPEEVRWTLGAAQDFIS